MNVETHETASNLAAPPDAAPAAPSPVSFEEMGVSEPVCRALAEMGFIEPMAVQKAVFPPMAAGHDLMVQSRTGSGKTAAFGIPMADRIVETGGPVQGLVLCPTRELALQVATECGRIAAHKNLSVVPVYGGAPMGKQLEQLKAGAQIVAGTPGRVLDHLRRGTLKLDKLKVLILDEADEMLSMGFYEEISDIIQRCPTERQTVLFSATIPEEIERIGKRYMKAPQKIELSAGYVGVHEIQHAYYMVSGMGRARDLERILEVERPESAIIFCNTREDTASVAEYLRRVGLDAEAISGDLTQKDRERVMGRMKTNSLKYLVATDIAARGIDISDLSHVFNYTFPESAEVYVHRTGRTGRAGKSGVAISLVSPRELGNFYMLKLTYKIKPEERPLPSGEETQAARDGVVADRLREELKLAASDTARAPVSERWLSVARRVWSRADGPELVARLIEEKLAAHIDTLPGSLPPIAAPKSDTSDGERSAGRSSGRPMREARGSRGERPSRGDRPSPRSDRPERNDRSSRSAAPERSSLSAAPPAKAVERPTAAAPALDDEEAMVPTRRRKRSESRNPAKAAAARPAATSPNGPTIDTSDGREFWEAWVDSRDAGAATGAPAAATTPASASTTEAAVPRRAPRVTPPGQVRLYLNLGKRDQLTKEQIAEKIAATGIGPAHLDVQLSHTYVTVSEESAPRLCAALAGQPHGDRAIVCEPAKK